MKARLSENIVASFADTVVLPSTITDDFMQNCIAAEPMLATITTEQKIAFSSMFRKFCDHAVAAQMETAKTAPAKKTYIPRTPTATEAAGSGLKEADRPKTKRKDPLIDDDVDVDLTEEQKPPPPKVRTLEEQKEEEEREKAKETDHQNAMDQMAGKSD